MDITPDMARAELERRRAAPTQPEAQSAATVTPDMARAELDRRKASAAPEGDDPNFTRGYILPLGKDKTTGEVSLAVPGIIKDTFDSAKSAVTAPGRAMSGELQVMGPDGNVSPEAIGEGANFAMWASPASAAARGVEAPAIAPSLKPKPPGLQVAEAAQRLGVEVPKAATSDSLSMQQGGKILSNVPVAGTPLRQASQKAIGQLDDAATKVQQGFGSGNPALAGSAAREGITDYSKNILTKQVADKYDAVDNLVTPNVTTPLTATAKVAGDIIARRANSHMTGGSKAVDLINQAIAAKDGLNYEGIKYLRTSIGEILDSPEKLVASKIPEADLNKVYAGLSSDLRNSVSRSGGEKALAKFEEANTFAANVANDRQKLQKVFGRDASDEGIFSKIVDMAGTTSRADQDNMMRVRKAVSPETWDEISSAVVSRLGRAPDGTFSPDRFLTSYGKLSDQGKQVLFRTTGKEDLASSLDDLAKVSQRFRQLNQFANPSGTGQTVMGGAFIPAMYTAPLTTITSIASGRVIANMLAKPSSARALAKWAKAYETAAQRPGAMTGTVLRNRSKMLANELVKETGDKLLADKVMPAISMVSKSPAEVRNEDNGTQEQQQPSEQQQLPVYDPNVL